MIFSAILSGVLWLLFALAINGHLPPIGFESALYLTGLLLWGALAMTLLTLLIALVQLVKRKTKPSQQQ